VAALREILGEIAEVFAQVLDRSQRVGGPDSLFMQLRLENGAIGQYFSCYTAKDTKETTFELIAHGTAGTLRVSNGAVSCVQKSGGRQRHFKVTRFEGGYSRQWDNFCRAISLTEPLLSTPEKAFGDLQVIEAALRSAQSGRKIRLMPSKTS
jgi:predicted dehydrogenase